MTDPVKVTIYIVRHGECIGNSLQKAIDPATDFLTDVGKEQADLLGKCLKDVPFTRIYASDYPRTLQTAQIILKRINENSEKQLRLQPQMGLRERDYTGFIGCEASVAVKMMMDQMREGSSYLQVDLPNCETTVAFERRVANFFSGLVNDIRKNSENSEENVLFVSHGLCIQRIMVLLNQRSSDMGVSQWTKNLFAEKLMKNTNYHRLILEIPRDPEGKVTGHVDRAHFREHVTENDGDHKNQAEHLQDKKNYTFLENTTEIKSHEEEVAHYCRPV